jgi:hypothetical protein
MIEVKYIIYFILLIFIIYVFAKLISPLVLYYILPSKPESNLTEKVLIDVFSRKLQSGFESKKDEEIALKYIKIAYKQLCNKELNEDEYYKHCEKNLKLNKKTKSVCLNVILNKYLTSDKIKKKYKKDLFAAYFLSLLKNRLPYNLLTENDYYDEDKQILFIKDYDIPRKINDNFDFLFSSVFIFRNETSVDDIKNDLYNIFIEIQKESDTDLSDFDIC